MSGAAFLGLRSDDPAEWRGALEKVQEQCCSAIETMRAFLGFAKRRDDAERKTFTAGTVLEQVRRLVRNLAARSDVELRIEVGQDAEVRGEARLAIQAVLNLVTNSIQALGGRPGAVELCADRPRPEICRLVVADDGPGIPEGIRGRLFRPFATEREDGRGHGLGLFIVKRTVRRLDGTIRVRSGPGGTTFAIDLPAL